MANLPTTMEYFDNLLGEQLTEGGGGSSDETWNTVFEGSVTTVDDEGSIVYDIENLTLNANTIRVTLNGTVYELPKTAHGYGAEDENGDMDFSTYPLYISQGQGAGFCTLWTPTAGTYSLKIEEPQSGGGGSSDLTWVIPEQSVELNKEEIAPLSNVGEIVDGDIIVAKVASSQGTSQIYLTGVITEQSFGLIVNLCQDDRVFCTVGQRDGSWAIKSNVTAQGSSLFSAVKIKQF